MLLLAIDTANRDGSIAVLRDGRLDGVVSTASDETYSSRLFREIDSLLNELHIKVSDFDVFAVAAGPGSFTGLRVGLTAIKAWAEVFEKPIVAMSGLEAIAAQVQPNSGELIAPVLDAHRGQIYAALYRFADSGLILEEPEQVSAAEEFLARIASRTKKDRVRFISPCPGVLQLALDAWVASPPGISRTIEPASAVLAPFIGRLALNRAARGEFTDALRLDANYIRRSDAELLWKEP